MNRHRWWIFLVFIGWLVSGCERPSLNPTTPVAVAATTRTTAPIATPTLASTGTPRPTASSTAIPPTSTATFTPSPTPFFNGTLSPPCGLILPILSTNSLPVTDTLTPDEAAMQRLRERIPDAALPALLHLLAEPDHVGLAAYRLGQEADGAYLNADVPMPLASVVKVINLVAYAEAVSTGSLDPLQTVALADLEAFYLPGLDLGAHTQAITTLTENGRIFGDPPNVVLDAVPEMMIHYSSNAASDYLHMLLGQQVIEETAVSLNLTSQTAPCPFVGQFLAMANYTRANNNDVTAIRQFADAPAEYGAYAMLLTDAYSNDPVFRAAQIDWRQQARRPKLEAQRLFTALLNPQGSAADYARLMARIASNGLSNGDSSYIARRYLEWPMQFSANQALFTNLGYKNGSLPGVLTTVYYAYPIDNPTPIVVALFFHDLPNQTYQQWRRNLPHDELARWLLYDPEAITILRDVLK
ncbi:MAG: serine hydrolase [Ardenticatenaceae bacterium]|nr:serine hydrolase [Ardenticatenaceae bacterium]